MDWIISEEGFERDKIIGNGNKFMTGNGYMGCRGTIEEYRKSEYTGINLAGVYDRHGEQWRETVNAPNPLFTKLFVDGNEISLLSEKPAAHEQSLNIRMGLHRIFRVPAVG
ncbi:Nigerose phosphorylase [Caprobacter fermentans]|uniref:Nigerose phosphorylase n=1 Tax=Caproicibacter fermentans TaxID=2576756 RepID=A0A6N8I0Y1_9FIRM|nr:hypothetical protein [Caproicibacter fermentans]MVB11692.1 Nigerose phosphorylase [Caproicibacter fermentans]OCN02613.1 hypothetical protein A7X67_18700 [Clostridium sp. W14A]QNK39732.1 hypothetical protein HCR03_13495 [Caproicibacter fermentans]